MCILNQRILPQWCWVSGAFSAACLLCCQVQPDCWTACLLAPHYLTHRSVNAEANTWTQILMRFSHPKQITHKDISAYEDKWMKNGCLPGFAFSNSKIFTRVVLECCGPFVLTRRLTPGDEFFRNDQICPVTASVRPLEVRCGATWMLGFERGGKREWCKHVKVSLKCLSVWCRGHRERCS